MFVRPIKWLASTPARFTCALVVSRRLLSTYEIVKNVAKILLQMALLIRISYTTAWMALTAPTSRPFVCKKAANVHPVVETLRSAANAVPV